jgi:NAD(P)-dependent dehydrogenase (short-subunit alcohol dehydrogenase family)
MERHVLVLGTNPAKTNIGSAIERALAQHVNTTGLYIRNLVSVPTERDFDKYLCTDLVVACGLTVMKPFETYRDHDVSDVIEACLTTPMIAARRWARVVLDSPLLDIRCNLVFIGSYAHDHVLTNSAPYCAAKAGIDMAARCLAWELTGRDINVFVVHPHSVQETPMTEDVLDTIAFQKGLSELDALRYWERNMRLGQRLTKDEIGAVVTSLILDPWTPHMSGNSIELYGGER